MSGTLFIPNDGNLFITEIQPIEFVKKTSIVERVKEFASKFFNAIADFFKSIRSVFSSVSFKLKNGKSKETADDIESAFQRHYKFKCNLLKEHLRKA